MDITGLGAAYIDEYRLGGGVVNQGNAGNGLPNFEDLLKRTIANAAPETETPSAPVTVDKTSELYKQCLELEIFMVKTMVNGMRNTVQKSGLIEEGFAGKMYEDMLFDEYARKLTENAGFGMAELAYLELTGQRGKVITR